MTCPYCNIKENALIVYGSDKYIAMLSDAPVTPGHILLFPKHHYTILEQVPDDEIADLFAVANDLSVRLFEKMNISGTNIIVNNGVTAGQTVPHFMLNIIPRKENDGLDFQWPTKPVSDEIMADVMSKLISKDKSMAEEEVSEQHETEDENVLIEHVNRIP
jgi:histidine triad (HIT) family protein